MITVFLICTLSKVPTGNWQPAVVATGDLALTAAALNYQKDSQDCKEIWDCPVSSDGKLISAVDRSDNICVWNQQSRAKLLQLRTKYAEKMSMLPFGPNGDQFSGCSSDSDLSSWYVQSDKSVATLPSGSGQPFRMAVIPGSKQVALGKGAKGFACKAHDLPVQQVVFSTMGDLLASRSADWTICVWDVATQKLVARQADVKGIEIAYRNEFPIAFLPDDKGLAFIREDDRDPCCHCKYWDYRNNTTMASFDLGSCNRSGFAFAPDCRTVAFSRGPEGMPRLVVSLASRPPKRLLEIPMPMVGGPFYSAEPMCFSPDAKTIAVSDSKVTFHIHELATGKKLGSYGDEYRLLQKLLFTPSGEFIASVGHSSGYRNPVSSSLVMWHLASGKKLFQSKQIEAGINGAAFSRDGLLLALCNTAREVSIWDPLTGELLLVCKDEKGSVEALAFSPDGTMLATGSGDGTILLRKLTSAGDVKGALGAKDLELLWNDLGNSDGKKAYNAICRLAACKGDTVAWCKAHFKPVQAAGADCFDQLISALDSDKFQKRAAATRKLTGMGVLAEPTLRKALAQKSSEETRARIVGILPLLPGRGIKDADTLRVLRGIHLLQRIDTPEAWKILENLAQGAPSCQTQEAQAVLKSRQNKPFAVPTTWEWGK